MLQIFFNLILLASFLVLWVRLKRPPQDDPRLSRGLQILQSKISILEDLSDRTERQVAQLTELLETKARHLNNKLIEADQKIQKVDQSMYRSLEVAEIFQDKIPHGEIIERQNTIKYIKAALMAHRGLGVEAILEQVDLPRDQVEFIAKVNRDQLMFDQDQLPIWAQHELEKEVESSGNEEAQELDQAASDFVDHSLFSEGIKGEPDFIESPEEEDMVLDLDLGERSALDRDPQSLDSLKKLGEEFRAAQKAPAGPSSAVHEARPVQFSLSPQREEQGIRPVQFRRIDAE